MNIDLGEEEEEEEEEKEEQEEEEQEEEQEQEEQEEQEEKEQEEEEQEEEDWRSWFVEAGGYQKTHKKNASRVSIVQNRTFAMRTHRHAYTSACVHIGMRTH